MDDHRDDAHAPTVSATVPDWSREALTPGEWNRGKRLLHCIRRYQHWKQRGGILGQLLRRWYVYQWRRWSVASGADIPLNTRIGGGLLLPHPGGVVIHPSAEIGVNCLIQSQVTIGVAADPSRLPRIGGHVDIGTGAKILGDVTIGDHARIGANAVVLKDVPPGTTAVGVPARIILPANPPLRGHLTSPESASGSPRTAAAPAGPGSAP